MPKDKLSTLIRLHRLHLDEKRRVLVQLQTAADRLEGQLRQLDVEMEQEKQTAAVSEETGYAYANYLKAARQRRERLERQLSEVQKQVDAANEDVATAFQEVKRYEIVSDNRAKAAQKTFIRRENAQFDEVALVRFQRQDSGEE